MQLFIFLHVSTENVTWKPETKSSDHKSSESFSMKNSVYLINYRESKIFKCYMDCEMMLSETYNAFVT